MLAAPDFEFKCPLFKGTFGVVVVIIDDDAEPVLRLEPVEAVETVDSVSEEDEHDPSVAESAAGSAATDTGTCC